MKGLKDYIKESQNEQINVQSWILRDSIDLLYNLKTQLSSQAISYPDEYRYFKNMKEYKECVKNASNACLAWEFNNPEIAKLLTAGIIYWLGFHARENTAGNKFETWMELVQMTDNEKVRNQWLTDLYYVVKKIYSVDPMEEFA